MGPQLDSDWPIYPEIGYFSPTFPAFQSNKASLIEFGNPDDENETGRGAIRSWVNDYSARLEVLELQRSSGSRLRDFGALL